MKKAVNYLRGVVRVKVECPYPERLVNACAAAGIEFWDLKRVSPTTVYVSMHIGGYRKLRSMAEKAGFEIAHVAKSGVPFFLWRLRRRRVLLAGMVLCFMAVWGLSLFVWEIDVKGNSGVPAQRILGELDSLGFGIGSFGPAVNSEAYANEMILRIPEILWIAVNVNGSHADVLVRERIPKPQILDEDAPTMVCAAKSGIITKMSVLEGARVLKVGDTVQAGDVIVTGVMDSIASGRRLVHAMAEVYARTWYEISARMPLETGIKRYTGRAVKRTALVIAGRRINLYFDSGIPFDSYDKISKKTPIRLPGGSVLPVKIVTDECMEYEASAARLLAESAAKILEGRLLDRLKSLTPGGEVVSTAFESEIEGGVITVKLTAECMEQIATERPFTAEELESAAAADGNKDKAGN